MTKFVTRLRDASPESYRHMRLKELAIYFDMLARADTHVEYLSKCVEKNEYKLAEGRTPETVVMFNRNVTAEDLPPCKTWCICSQHGLRWNFFIRHRDYDDPADIIIVGSSCITKFLPHLKKYTKSNIAACTSCFDAVKLQNRNGPPITVFPDLCRAHKA